MNEQPPLPVALQSHPDLDNWLAFHGDGSITVYTGKVEIGQGIRTVIAQIAADELDVALERIQVVLADTGRTPNEGVTAGSNSTQGSGGAVRQACAEARHHLLVMAATELDAPVEQLQVYDGTIIDPQSETQTSYWQLIGDRPLNQQAIGRTLPKSPQEYKLVGTSVPRLDIPGKVRGEAVFVDDMSLPTMVHGRIVRPPRPGATLQAVDLAPVQAMPGVVAVVQDGSFLGIVAEREEQAVRAADLLRTQATWQRGEDLPDEETVYDQLTQGESQPLLVVDGVPVDDPIPSISPPQDAAHTLSAEYSRPFLLHGALGPSSGLAHMDGGQLTIWTHSQGVYPLRESIAQVLGMDADSIRVIHVEGPGCYGHNGADDAAFDAALLACSVPGRPVLLKWTRADEHLWEPYGTPMMVQLHASLDDNGNVIDWNHDGRSFTHSGRPRPQPGASGLLSARYLETPIPPPQPRPGRGYHGGIHRNADPLYAFPKRRIVKHFIPNSPFRTSSLRSLGAFANIFAIESFMDELAAAANIDPIEFRLRHLVDERARAVLQAAADAADWQPGIRSGIRIGRGHGAQAHTEERTSSQLQRGRGIAFAQYKNEKCYAAVIMTVGVDMQLGTVRLDRATVVADAGVIINPDGLRNQLEGGVIQSASWTLKEAVRYDATGVQSVDWQSYPILTFGEAPEIEVVLLEPPGEPSLGAGEAVQGPTPAAIANAIYDAVGIRMRHTPFTPARILSALAK